MTFAGKLNEYMMAFNCTPKKLVSLSGVSAATVSRYRAGTREPAADSDLFDKLVNGLSRAAEDAGYPDASRDEIRRELLSVMDDDRLTYDPDVFRLNLDLLINKLHLNTRELASRIGIDQSRFFRIRTGQSRPADIEAFCDGVAGYIFGMPGDDAPDILSDILGCTPSELTDEASVRRRISDLLTGVSDSPRAYAESFLRELDRFNIDDYFSVMDASSYFFSGEAEKAFIASLETAPADSSAIICTDLYSGDADEDRMMKNLEYIIAALVSRGVHIDLVLNADNPMDEILPGLIHLLPVSMSGKISVFYLRGRRDGIYRYRLVSLKNAALCCEAVTGHYDTVITRVASSEDEIYSYRQRAEQILAFSSPLIEVIDNSEDRLALLTAGEAQPGKRVLVLSTPPFFAMNGELLDRILRRNGVDPSDASRIRQYIQAERSRVLRILRHSEYVCSFPDIPRDQYDEKPVFLSLSGLLYKREILCTYDEYAEHIRLMRELEKEYENFRCIADKNSPFRNIQIFMHTGQHVMLSKNKAPAIHLVIEHSKLRSALENILSSYGEA